MYYDIAIFSQFVITPTRYIVIQCYGSENFFKLYSAMKSGLFYRIFKSE